MIRKEAKNSNALDRNKEAYEAKLQDKDKHITKEYKILKPCYNGRGYLDVTLKINKNKVHKVITKT